MRIIQQTFLLLFLHFFTLTSTFFTPDVQLTPSSTESSTFSDDSSTQASTYSSSIFSYFYATKKQTEAPKAEKLTMSPEPLTTSLFSTVQDTLRMVASTEESQTTNSQFTTSDETFTTFIENFTVDSKYGDCMQKCFQQKYFPLVSGEDATTSSMTSVESTQSDFLTSTLDPSTTTTESDAPTSNWLVDELIKVTQELHEMRVKFISLSHELTEEKKLREVVESELKVMNESQNETFETFGRNFELQSKELDVCNQKLDDSSKVSNYLAKLANIEKFKSGIAQKVLEFDLTEEIQTSNKTVMKFLMFELESDESQVNLVSNQNLITIPSRLVDIAPKLSEFSASNCGLEFVDATSFEELKSLRVLNLSKNSISKIENETFVELKFLEIFDLSFNSIEILEILSFEGLEKLLDLNLSNNKISSLPSGIFQNLATLEILKLSQNSIKELKLEIFPSKLSIIEFCIDNNLLTNIDAKLIVALEGALTVDMKSNLCIDTKVPDTGSMLELGIQVFANCSNKEIN